MFLYKLLIIMLCGKCKKEKNVESFMKDDKLLKTCQECREIAKKTRERTFESRSLYQKHYQEKKRDGRKIRVVYARLLGSGNEWQKFSTQREAAAVLGVYPANVNKVIHGQLKSTGGYEFKEEIEIYRADTKEWGEIKTQNGLVDRTKGQPSQHRIQHEERDGVTGKRCCTCREWRPLTEFNKSSSHWDQLRIDCKMCLSEYRVQNKDRMQEYNKTYWQKTMDSQKEKNKQWREANQERIKENMRRWLEENAEYKKAKDKEYREAHRDQKREYNRIWVKESYHKLKQDPDNELFTRLRVKKNLSRRLRELLRQQKSLRCIDYVGCSFDKLRMYLESRFEDGMNWYNYGNVAWNKMNAWHIDHIIPCASFDMSNPVHQLACFHYKNIQPMWGIDNIKKHASFDVDKRSIYLERFINTHIIP